MNSWFPTKDTTCPSCGSKNSAGRKSKGWLKGELARCAERVCNDCGAVFEPTAKPGWALTAMGMGALMSLMALVEKGIDAYHSLLSLAFVRLVLDLLYLIGVGGFGIQLIAVG